MELMDPTGRWWGDAELDDYITTWQDTLQDEFESVWSVSTATLTPEAATGGGNANITWDQVTVTWDQMAGTWDTPVDEATAIGTNTFVLLNLASDMLRLDAVYWNNLRLIPVTTQELGEGDVAWESRIAASPTACYQKDYTSVSFYPSPTQTGTVVFEYPKKLGFTDSSSPMQLPAWMKFSVVNFACASAFSRLGPNQDLQKAAKYESLFNEQRRFYKLMKDRFFPQRILSLRPGGGYEGNIVKPTNASVLLSV
jgi:hypothetical protein